MSLGARPPAMYSPPAAFHPSALLPASAPNAPKTMLHPAAAGAQDRASPNFMGLYRFKQEIDILCDFIYSVLLLSVILGLYFLGLALPATNVKSTGLAQILQASPTF